MLGQQSLGHSARTEREHHRPRGHAARSQALSLHLKRGAGGWGGCPTAPSSRALADLLLQGFPAISLKEELQPRYPTGSPGQNSAARGAGRTAGEAESCPSCRPPQDWSPRSLGDLHAGLPRGTDPCTPEHGAARCGCQPAEAQAGRKPRGLAAVRCPLSAEIRL